MVDVDGTCPVSVRAAYPVYRDGIRLSAGTRGGQEDCRAAGQETAPTAGSGGAAWMRARCDAGIHRLDRSTPYERLRAVHAYTKNTAQGFDVDGAGHRQGGADGQQCARFAGAAVHCLAVRLIARHPILAPEGVGHRSGRLRRRRSGQIQHLHQGAELHQILAAEPLVAPMAAPVGMARVAMRNYQLSRNRRCAIAIGVGECGSYFPIGIPWEASAMLFSHSAAAES